MLLLLYFELSETRVGTYLFMDCLTEPQDLEYCRGHCLHTGVRDTTGSRWNLPTLAAPAQNFLQNFLLELSATLLYYFTLVPFISHQLPRFADLVFTDFRS